jgi:hypothetical protein
MKKQPESIIFLASSILILGIFLGISFNPVFAEINTDKLVYSKGELVEISGTIDLQTNQSVNLVEIKITNGDNTIIDEYIPLNNNSFSKYYDSNTWTSGEYKATISHNDTEEYTEFENIGSSTNSNSNNTRKDKNSTQQKTYSALSKDTRIYARNPRTGHRRYFARPCGACRSAGYTGGD